MNNLRKCLFTAVVLAAALATTGLVLVAGNNNSNNRNNDKSQSDLMFSMSTRADNPLQPQQTSTAILSPGSQYRKLVITDVHAWKEGLGDGYFTIWNAISPNQMLWISYQYKIPAGQVLSINYTTGFMLETNATDPGPKWAITNFSSQGAIHYHITGYYVE
jgi:hypothetical protein